MGGKPVIIEESYQHEDRGYRSPCWIWKRARNSYGYGVVRIDGVLQLVHRVMYERSHGPIPKGMQLDHLCRQRACANPEHLEPVTGAENVRRGNLTTLTWEDVRAIRDSTMPVRDIAKAYGVTVACISKIRSGQRWKEGEIDSQGNRGRHGGKAGRAHRQEARGVG